MLDYLKNEPVLIASIIAAIVAVAAVFGVDVDADQLVGILALFGIVAAPVVRAKVQPTRKGQ